MAAPVLIMAGGTGGHIFPGLAVAAALRAQDVPVVWLGAEGGLETRLVPAAGLPIETVQVAGVRGKDLGRRLRAPWMLLRAVWQARVMKRGTSATADCGAVGEWRQAQGRAVTRTATAWSAASWSKATGRSKPTMPPHCRPA